MQGATDRHLTSSTFTKPSLTPLVPWVSSPWPPLAPYAISFSNSALNRLDVDLRRAPTLPSHGDAAPELPTAGRAPPTSSVPSDLKSTHPIRRYPFWVNLSKEPLSFLRIEPAVRIRPLEICFLFENVKSAGLIQKYVFSKLQVCHWICLAHENFVWTLIWPVQIALVSYLKDLRVSKLGLLIWNFLISWP